MIDILFSLWLIFPAYVANASPVIFRGKLPIDFGKTWNGKPLLGKGKTWRGLFGGTCAGMVTGLLMNDLHPSFGEGMAAVTVLFSLSFGALLGDLFKSFLKRRMGKERGEHWVVADQIDFLLGAFLLCFALNRTWFVENFTIYRILFLLIFTPLLHVATNILAYVLKLKKVPW